MKILHFVNGRCNFDSANGVDKTVYYLTRELAAIGNDVHLISATEKEVIPIEGVTIHKVAPFTPTLWCSREVSKLIKALEPDFGHLHSAYVPENIAVARYFRKLEVPYVVTPNGNCSRSLMKRKPWIKGPYKMILERPYLNQAAFIHSVGDETEIKHYGVKVPILEALNGIDLTTLPQGIEKKPVSTIVPAFSDRFVFVFVGRLDIEQKGLDLLIEAVALLKKEGLKPGVLLVGPCWKGSRVRIEAMIQDAGVKDCFHLQGPAYGEEKFEMVVAGGAFIHASRWEGLPFSVVEAMAMNQLCVVTPAADPAGRIAAKKAGVNCDLSAEGIAKGMRQAMSLKPEERNDLIANSAEIVRSDMDWSHIARRVSDGYRKFR